MKFRSLLLVIAILGLGACSTQKTNTLRDMEHTSIVIDVDAPVEVERRDAIKYYRSLMEFDIDNRYRARAMKRLADLEMEEGEQKEIDESRPLTVEEIKEFEVSIDIYKELLKTYPEFEGNDQVLYQLARAYERLVMVDESMEALTRLVQEYPSSPLFDEVQFRRGEIFFVDGDYEQSAAAYESVIQFGESSRFYELALHKHGWNLLKLDRFDEALVSFFTLLDLKLGSETLSEDPFEELPIKKADKELVDDTLYAMSLVFSYIDDIDYVQETIEKRGRRNYDHVVYNSFAQFYMKQTRYEDAVNIYTKFSVHYTDSPYAAFFKLKLIDIFNKAKEPERALNAKKHFVQVYGPNTPFWADYSEFVQKKLMVHVKNRTRELTEHYHELAQQSKALEDYQNAEKWYRFYLKAVPVDEDTPKVHFLLADLLYDGGLYSVAAEEYEYVAYQYGPHEKGQDAGYAAIMAHREHLKLLSAADRVEWSAKQIASVLQYTETYSQDTRLISMLVGLAEESFNAGEMDKALMLAQRVIDMGDKVPLDMRSSAWRVSAHVEFEKGYFKKAEEGYQYVISFTEGEVQPEVYEWIAASIYKQGEVKQKSGDLEGAVSDYQRIASIVPFSETRIQAEYDAAAVLMDMKDWNRAILALQNFRRNYPEHELQNELPLKLAAAYLENGQQLEAAQEYEQIARNEIYNEQIRREAAWQAAELFQQNNQLRRSVFIYELYVKNFPEPFEQSIEAKHRLTELYSSLGQINKYNHMLNQLVAESRADNPGHTERTRFIVAEAALRLADAKLNDFSSVKLVEPLQKSLKDKKARMEEALSAYNKAAEYEVAGVVTASTYRIGEIYQQFGKSLMNSERPSDLSEEELEEYDLLLEEQAYPFEEKAIEILQSNSERTLQGLYDTWVEKSYDKLREIMPARYSKFEKGVDIVEALY